MVVNGFGSDSRANRRRQRGMVVAREARRREAGLPWEAGDVVDLKR
jgi:hypothetical protein